MYKTADVEVEIEFDDVIEYITNHATDSEISSIRREIDDSEMEDAKHSSKSSPEGTYVQGEKIILLNLAAKKYSLEELEQRLGNKFDLI
jgi:hypothetical protein